MGHYQEKFHFININGEEVEVLSRPYSFSLEKVLIKRFGKESIDKFLQDHQFNHRVTLQDVQEDFPKLLLMDDVKIDFGMQEGKYFDEIKKVYFFFIEYDSNASLRLSLQLKETLASAMKEINKALGSIQPNG